MLFFDKINLGNPEKPSPPERQGGSSGALSEAICLTLDRLKLTVATVKATVVKTIKKSTVVSKISFIFRTG